MLINGNLLFISIDFFFYFQKKVAYLFKIFEGPLFLYCISA